MAKYHTNAAGVSSECKAVQGKCPFGTDAQHYPTADIARQAYELSMAALTVAVPTKREPEFAPPTREVYHHPQGKTAIFENGVLRFEKDGKRASSSSTIEQLRAGRGSWRLDESDDSSIVVTPVDHTLSPEEKLRQRAIGEAGYPTSTKLDPSKGFGFPDREPVIQPRWSGHGRAVLPTGTRIEPHKNPGDNEYVEDWAKFETPTFIVVKQRGDSRDTYRAIFTSSSNGTLPDIIGDEFLLEHDQTQQPIGRGGWKVVGAFAAEPGGAAVGEIPDQKIPMYVYK